MKKQIIIESKNPTFIVVDGKKYILEKESLKKIDNVVHSDKLIYKEFDESEEWNYEHYLDLIIEAIDKRTAKKELIKELIKNIDFKMLRRLGRRIEKGELIKKQEGCLGFKIGDAYIQLID